jgi:hypothetical protein
VLSLTQLLIVYQFVMPSPQCMTHCCPKKFPTWLMHILLYSIMQIYYKERLSLCWTWT